MISEIKQAIVNKLLEVFPVGYRRYEDDVPQNFKTPSFLITITDQEYSKRLSNKFRSTLSFDVAYFSDKGAADSKSDCLRVQEDLLRAFDMIGSFRVENKRASIVDSVLHFTFDVTASEMIPESFTAMESQTTTTDVK